MIEHLLYDVSLKSGEYVAQVIKRSFLFGLVSEYSYELRKRDKLIGKKEFFESPLEAFLIGTPFFDEKDKKCKIEISKTEFGYFLERESNEENPVFYRTCIESIDLPALVNFYNHQSR